MTKMQKKVDLARWLRYYNSIDSKEQGMQNEIQNLLNAIVDDYRLFLLGSRYLDYDNKMSEVEKFADGLAVKEGKKYIKIEKQLGSQTMVWGFVVGVDTDKKFRKGDILMAAGFNAPARNKPRGNVLDNDFDVTWSGPKYL